MGRETEVFQTAGSLHSNVFVCITIRYAVYIIAGFFFTGVLKEVPAGRYIDERTLQSQLFLWELLVKSNSKVNASEKDRPVCPLSLSGLQ